MDTTEQYKTPDNLKSRMGLYRYSTSALTFHQWISTVLPRQQCIKILELGCGTGTLWKSLIDNFPNSRITLSDRSENMLEEARQNLKGLPLDFAVIDFHDLPFPDESFDLIISNHNLYHAEDLNKVLKEIRRVLTRQGTFLCSTNSSAHLIELKKILSDRGIGSLWPNEDLTNIFGMENGGQILSPHFASVNQYTYKSKLHITDPQAVIDYFNSVRSDEIKEVLKTEEDLVSADIKRHIESGLFFEVRTEPGIFICHK